VERLRNAATLYRFVVVRIDVLRPKQLAPAVVVRVRNPERFTRDVPAVLALVDPRAPAPDDRLGWAYEGFYFEVRDEDGVPAIIVRNWWRGHSAGGGQWARSESLYPFAHG
jgi:hypothetical protein